MEAVAETKKDLQKAVLKQLGRGKDEALSGKILADRLNEKDTRHIRLAIIDLVVSGIPICSAVKKKGQPSGYYIAQTPEECQESLNQLMSYIKMLARHHKYLLRASRNIIDPYQTKMRF